MAMKANQEMSINYVQRLYSVIHLTMVSLDFGARIIVWIYYHAYSAIPLRGY